MSELKAYTYDDMIDGDADTNIEYYPKSEADKVIAELEESHKMEVEQLLIEIVKLKADYKEACGRLLTANLIKDEQLAVTRHSKYKRCLAMARMCEERSARYDVLQERHDLDWGREIEFYYRWYKRWLELADKFKEAE